MKIYHVLPEWEPFSAFYGGAVAGSIAEMMRLNSARSVICSSTDNSEEYGAERVIVLPLYAIYGKLRGRGRIPLTLTSKLLRIIFEPVFRRVQENDILWFHNAPLVAASLSQQFKAHRVTVVYHSHSSIRLRTAKHFPKIGADAVVFVSESMREEAHAMYPLLSRSYVVHNGVNSSVFKPQKADRKELEQKPLIVYVGRLHPEKGPHVLIEAINILNSRGVETRCRIVGSSKFGGSRMTRYTSMLHKMAPCNVSFHGHLSHDDVVREFQDADLFCCPSLYDEPFGKVVIEALACGVPVVASKVGGIPEIARGGGVILAEPGSADSLADCLDLLLSDKERLMSLSLAGMASVNRQFTISSMEQRLRMIGEEISGRRSVIYSAL
jgi:spore coat protein SA